MEVAGSAVVAGGAAGLIAESAAAQLRQKKRHRWNTGRGDTGVDCML